MRAAAMSCPSASSARASQFSASASNCDVCGDNAFARCCQRARAAFAHIDSVLDIVPDEEAADAELGAWIEERIAARREARQRRDFGEADRIRTELSERGVVIEDAGGETRWKLG